MEGVSILSCRCCMFESCVYPCNSPQCYVLHDFQSVNGRRCKRGPYGRDIIQSRSHDCLVGNH